MFGLSSLLVFVLVFLPVGSMIVNGFQYPFGRYPFIILPIMTVVFTTGADYLFEERKLDLPVVACSILFLSIVLLTKGGEWSGNILPTTEARRHTLWALNVVFIVAALMSTKKNRWFCITLYCRRYLSDLSMIILLQSANGRQSRSAGLKKHYYRLSE